MLQQQTCLTDQQFQALLEVTLPDQQLAPIASHLESCQACRERLELLAGGSGLVPQEVVGEPGPAVCSTALEEAIRKLKDGHDVGETLVESNPGPPSLTFLSPSAHPRHLGRLGSYEILEVIGRGGMGTVLKARDAKLERLVAVKVLNADLASHGAARKRFLGEARSAAAVSHEHVVTIHAVEDTAEVPYLVMEYVLGVSLEDRIERSGHLRVEEILRIGMQTASGLTAAHAQGLVHRDIKPSNILLENGVERVKITDFGLARVVHEAQLTRSDAIAGTPPYMSPEQARGKPVDHRSDLFSLGCVLYAMCVGRSPFRAETPTGAMHRVIEDTPRPIREINPEIPEWLVAIIDRLLQKDPADRFQTADEIAELLGKYLAELQQPSRMQGAVPQQSRSRRTPVGSVGRLASVAAASSSLGLLIVGVLAVATNMRKQDPAPQAEISLVETAPHVDPEPAIAPPIDLIHHIVPSRDAPRGGWLVLEDGGLLIDRRNIKGTPSGHYCVLKIPYLLPGEYDLDLDVQQGSGGGTLSLCFALEGEVRRAQFDAELSKDPAHIRCEVRRSELRSIIRVLCDGIPVELTPYRAAWPRFEDRTVTLHYAPSGPGYVRISTISLDPLSDEAAPVFADASTSRDRQIAEQVIWRGGTAKIAADGGGEPILVNCLKDVPHTSFRLLGVNLNAPASAVGAHGLLAGAEHLESISLRGHDEMPEHEIIELLGLSSRSGYTSAPANTRSPLPSLTDLDLGFTRIGNSGLASLESVGNLRRLCLAGSAISDEEGLSHLARHQSLEELDLSGCKLTNVSLQPIGRLRELQRLSLDHTSISSHDLTALGGLAQLRILSLIGTAVSDDAVEHLARLGSLREVSVTATDLTSDGLRAIEAALPQTTIEHSVVVAEDLLSLARLSDDEAQTEWRWDEGIFIPRRDRVSMCEVRYSAPAEYVLETAVICSPDYFRAVHIGVPFRGLQAVVTLDVWPQLGCLSGIQWMDGYWLLDGVAGHEAIVLGQLLVPEQSVPVRVILRANHISVTCGERLIVHWKGDLQRLVSPSQGGVGNSAFSVSASRTEARFIKWSLTPVRRITRPEQE